MAVTMDAAGRARGRGPGGMSGGTIRTDSPILKRYSGGASASGVTPTEETESDYALTQGSLQQKYDKWRTLFSNPTPYPYQYGKGVFDIIQAQPPTGPPPLHPDWAPAPSTVGPTDESIEGQREQRRREPDRARGRGENAVRPPGLYQTEEEKELEKHAKKLEADRARLLDLATKAKLIGESYLPSELDAIWQEAVDQAQASAMAGEDTTPWDILEFWANDPVQARKYGGVQPSAPDIEEITPPLTLEERTSVSTSTATAISDPRVAKIVLRNGLKAYLGRQPRDEEVAEFTSYLNTLERENPTITKQTTIVGAEPGDETTSETVTTGGALDPASAAEEYLEEDEEFSDEEFAYRMGTEGADVMRALVGSLV